MAELTRLSRIDNQNAIETLKKNGVQVVPPPDQETLESYYSIGVSARNALVGKYYSKELLEKIESAVADFRKDGARQ
jgi:hypothetical protein